MLFDDFLRYLCADILAPEFSCLHNISGRFGSTMVLVSEMIYWGSIKGSEVFFFEKKLMKTEIWKWR